MTVRRNSDCYTIELRRVQAFLALLALIVALASPAFAAYATWIRTGEHISRLLTREEAAELYLTREEARQIMAQRSAQLDALNTNITILWENQLAMNQNITRVMERLGVDGAAAPMKPLRRSSVLGPTIR